MSGRAPPSDTLRRIEKNLNSMRDCMIEDREHYEGLLQFAGEIEVVAEWCRDAIAALAQSPAPPSDALDAVAQAIHAARFAHPEHPREPAPWDRGDREYAYRLARAALAVQPPPDGALREALEHELATLERANAEATRWGAAVGARHERIKEIRTALSATPAQSDRAGREKLMELLNEHGWHYGHIDGKSKLVDKILAALAHLPAAPQPDTAGLERAAQWHEECLRDFKQNPCKDDFDKGEKYAHEKAVKALRSLANPGADHNE